MPWQSPDPLAGQTAQTLLAVQTAIDGKGYRANIQSAEWAGHFMAPVLGLGTAIPAEKKRIDTIIRLWVKSGALIITRVTDKKGNDRPVVEVGEWAKP